MSNFKNYNKSMVFNFQESPRFNCDTIKSIKSSELNNSKINEENGKNTFKNKLFTINKIEKDKFNTATKNEALLGRPNLKHINTIHPNRNKTYYMNILDSIYQNDSHLDRTNVKLKFNQNNMKNSSLIPFPKKISKDKLIKEEDIIKEDVKKNKKHSKRKRSDGDGNQFDTTGIKKKSKKYNSTHLILKMKKKSTNSLKKYTEIDKVRDILKDEKITKISKKVKENEDKSKDNNIKDKEENKSEKKNEGIINGNYIDQENKNINEKENKMNDNNSYGKKEIQIKKNNYNNEHNKDKVIVDINHVETKSKNEIVKFTNKEKEKGKKKRKGFPFCCCLIKDDSSDNEG